MKRALCNCSSSSFLDQAINGVETKQVFALKNRSEFHRMLICALPLKDS
jgi:hypothetical protein